MSVVSMPTAASLRKRLAGALIATCLCGMLGACGNDDDPAPGTVAANATDQAADSGNTSQILSANPSFVSPAPPALTIQTPALPASGDAPALSAAAPAPLAKPVIHTVD
jgi:hypothetical protein